MKKKTRTMEDMNFNVTDTGKQRLIAYDIQWDTSDANDDEDDEFDLPTEIEIPDGIDSNDDDAISDYLSDFTGFCHYGYKIREE